MKSNTKRAVWLATSLLAVFLCAVFIVLSIDGDDGEASFPSFAMTPGASLRISGDQLDLTFESRILSAELETLGDDVTIGILILPTDMKNGAITAETPHVLNLCSTIGEQKLKRDGEYSLFRATLTGIKSVNYTRPFSAVGYLKVGNKYYYTPYSDAENSVSLWQTVAKEWAGERRGSAVLKAFLDRIVVINASMIQSRTIEGYTSPYNVSYSDGVLRITAKDNTLRDGDITAIMLDYDHKTYTSGWTLENNVLKANFRSGLVVVESFDAMNEAEGDGFDSEHFSAEFASAPPSGLTPDGGENHYEKTNTSIAALDGSLTYIKGNAYDTSYPTLTLKGDVASALGEENDLLTLSLSLRIASGYKHAPSLTFKLSGADNSSVALFSTFEESVCLGSAGEEGREIASLTSDVWIDLSCRINLREGIMQVWCDGVLMGTAPLTLPHGYSNLLDWARENLTESALTATAGTMNYYRPNGIRLDSMSWGVSKSN